MNILEIVILPRLTKQTKTPNENQRYDMFLPVFVALCNLLIL